MKTESQLPPDAPSPPKCRHDRGDREIDLTGGGVHSVPGVVCELRGEVMPRKLCAYCLRHDPPLKE